MSKGDFYLQHSLISLGGSSGAGLVEWSEPQLDLVGSLLFDSSRQHPPPTISPLPLWESASRSSLLNLLVPGVPSGTTSHP